VIVEITPATAEIAVQSMESPRSISPVLANPSSHQETITPTTGSGNLELCSRSPWTAVDNPVTWSESTEDRIKVHETHETHEKREFQTRKGKAMAEILYKEESYRIIGACFEVYKDMVCGFAEPVYQECLQIELGSRGIPFEPQSEIRIVYKGNVLEQFYKPDFVCYEKIIVELKALGHLTGEHQAQVWNYLKATDFRLGLLINFGHHPLLEHLRIAL
jgi:GxxExxY protein